MVWTIKRIEAEYFMGFERLDLDLTKYRGITSVEGSRGAPGTSNGASKSTILEAIHWCLNGKLMRKQRKADKVVHRWAPSDARTVVRLTIDVDGREFIPERTRTRSGSPTLRAFLEGKPSTTAGVQDVINRTLGLLDDRTLTSTAIFSGGLAQFCQLTDSERKAALERMVGADHFSAGSKLAMEREKAALDRKTIADQKVMSISSEIDTLLSERGRAANAALQRSIIDAEELKEKRRACVRASVLASQTHDALVAYHEQANAAAKQADVQRSRLNAEIRAAQTEIDSADAGLVECAKQLGAANARVIQLRKERSDLEAGKHPDVCPTCAQRWPHEGMTPAALAKAVKKIDDQILAVRQDTAPIESRRDNFQATKSEAVRAKSRYTAEIEELNALTDTREERRLLTDALTAEAQLKSAHDALTAFMATLPDPEFGELNLDLSEEDARVDAARARLQAAQDEAREAADDARRYAFWKKGFGRSGLPSFLLDSSVPAMNQVVGKLASILTNGELSVSFNPAVAKGSNDLFAVEVEYADGGDDYDMTSTGEHTRVDLAVMFTLRDLVERRGGNRCSQLFLDEVLAGTDAAFSESVMNMFRTHYRDRDIFIISHDDSIKSLCDNTITVRKAGRAATVG